MPKVEVTIHEDGTIRPDFLEFEGGACIAADLDLRQRLAQFGITLAEVQITPKPELFSGHARRQALLQKPPQELQRRGESDR